MMQSQIQPPKPLPITTADEAKQAMLRLADIMDRLEAMVVEETGHVRAGRLRRAVEFDETKADLARAFTAESERVRLSAKAISSALPQAMDILKARQTQFRNLLQTNLTVLATAHAVSEGIIRGVSGEMARRQSPSTYGANGRASQPSPRAAQPISVSRSL